MTFKPGQKVICVDDNLPNPNVNQLRQLRIYTVKRCSFTRVNLVEFDTGQLSSPWFKPWRFVALEGVEV